MSFDYLLTYDYMIIGDGREGRKDQADEMQKISNKCFLLNTHTPTDKNTN